MSNEVADLISKYDAQQHWSNPDAQKCPNEGTPVKSQNGNNYSEHGNLQVHSSGFNLICGRCGFTTPIGRI